MTKYIKPIAITLLVAILLMGVVTTVGVVRIKAADKQTQDTTLVAETPVPQEGEAEAAAPQEAAKKEEAVDSAANKSTTGKAVSAAIVIGLAALGGTFSMSNAICKSNEGVARQPEAGGQIQTLLMLGLVFIETVVIYALIVAILIIFVL